jgi:hypothetical protein
MWESVLYGQSVEHLLCLGGNDEVMVRGRLFAEDE